MDFYKDLCDYSFSFELKDMKRINQMIIRILSILTICFALAACNAPRSSENISESSISVSQTQVFLGETFSILLPEIPPKNISVFTPDGEFYVLHSDDDGIALWPPSELKSPRNLEVKPSDLIGIKWVNGTKTKGHIFKSKGVYRFYLADNLETEPDNTYNLSVEVTYK